MKILDEVRGEYSVDSDRIYAMGLSMGGFGTWNLLMRHSDVFAAGIPICGGADVNKANVLKNVPIWTFHGTVDDVVPYAGTRDMAAAIEAAGGKVITFTSYGGQGHGVWELAAAEPELINWLFRQSLSDRVSETAAPTISNANYNTKANTVEISFDTTKCLWPSQTEKIVLAIYDENDQLAQVKTFSLGPISQTVRWRWSSTKIPAKVKVFVWSNSFAMQPVSGVATATFTS